MNILILRVSAIGDVIHTFPAATLLRACLPNARIDWIVQKKCASMVKAFPHVNNVWELEDRYIKPANWRKTFATMQTLRNVHWDAIIDFQGIEKTAILLALLRGKKFGFDAHNARSPLCSWFTHHHVNPIYTNIIQKNLALASAVVAHISNHTHQPCIQELQKHFTLQWNQDQRTSVDTWMTTNSISNPILLCPNTTWASKHWPLEHWQKLLQLLSQEKKLPNSIVLVGNSFGDQAAVLAQWLVTQSLPITLCPSFDLASMAYLISSASLVIAPDTGLLHLADFLGTQTIGIFGPTIGLRHGPFLHKKNQQSIIQIPCPHAYQKKHGSNDCMNQLKPKDLFDHIQNWGKIISSR